MPNGIFKSGFGMRRHPILGFARMHTGVDWAAPRGTPIIAAGNGVVEKAGWDSGGFGNQTLIRHANGYVSSYNHQSAIAKSVVPGAKVVQGQVIGFIGSTGLATGPHLHYELIVNGTKVDPLRIRLPGGKSLNGDALRQVRGRAQAHRSLLSDEKAKQVAQPRVKSRRSANGVRDTRQMGGRCRAGRCVLSHARRAYAASLTAARGRNSSRSVPLVTFTSDPSGTWPDRICSASGSCTYFWITRFSGRAP